MAKPAELDTESSEEPLSLKEQGARTVRALAEVSGQLFPLKERARKGETLGEDEQKLLDELDIRYRQLETEMRQLMRPRVKDPWLYGKDHGHGPQEPREERLA